MLSNSLGYKKRSVGKKRGSSSLPPYVKIDGLVFYPLDDFVEWHRSLKREGN